MGTLTDLSDIIYRLTSGGTGNPQTIFFSKRESTLSVSGVSYVNPAPNNYISLWVVNGSPGCGEIPTSSPSIPTNITAGGLKQNNPGVGEQQWLLNFSAIQNNGANVTPFNLILYDRLIHVGGLNATSTSLQTINLNGITRYSSTTDCVGNMILVEIYNDIGTTARNLTINYTNQDGIANRSVIVPNFGGTNNKRAQAFLVRTVSGDTGVKSVESVQLDGSTTVAGNFGVSIVRPLSTCGQQFTSLSNYVTNVIDVPSVVEILSNACLGLIFIPNLGSQTTGQLGNFFGHIQLVNK